MQLLIDSFNAHPAEACLLMLCAIAGAIVAVALATYVLLWVFKSEEGAPKKPRVLDAWDNRYKPKPLSERHEEMKKSAIMDSCEKMREQWMREKEQEMGATLSMIEDRVVGDEIKEGDLVSLDLQTGKVAKVDTEKMQEIAGEYWNPQKIDLGGFRITPPDQPAPPWVWNDGVAGEPDEEKGEDPRVEEMARELYIKLAHFNPWVVDQDPPRALGDLRDACYKSARVFYGVDECSTK